MTTLIALLSLAHAEDEPTEATYRPPPAIALVAPLGVPQLSQRRWLRGATYFAIQGGAFGFGSFATNRMYDASEAEDIEGERTWRMWSFAGIATGTATWFVSVLDASRYHQVQSEAYYHRAVEWEQARAGR